MSSINQRSKTKTFTHEGAPTNPVGAEEQLKRAVMCCMLWEDQFYENGVSIADRITDLVSKVDADTCFNVAVDARNKSKLRHVPLLIARVMAKLPGHRLRVRELLEDIIQRPDELTEFLAVYWKDKKQPLSAAVKKGLADAFKKFNEYQLAKYNRENEIKLRDVLFLCHPKPDTTERQEMWNRLVSGTLKTPDTWEVEISDKGSNKESWMRLLFERKLGALALLKNLRNMITCGVDKKVIKEALVSMKTDRVLPFRFIAAARYAPDLEPELEVAMFKCLDEKEKIKGKTVLLVDVSGSMDDKISGKSEMIRMDAAMGLAVLARELCEDVEIFSFSSDLIKIPLRRGFALRDAIKNSQSHSSTYLGLAMKSINQTSTYDRVIVITDEQSNDTIPRPKNKGYIINVASCQNGVGYGPWTHINGWSEAVLDFIREYEQTN